MPRNRKSSLAAEDLVTVVALLPWWGGIAAAFVSFLLLHHFAVTPGSKPAGVTGVNDLSRLVLPTMLGVFAYLAQLAVPLLCLVAAAISAWKARARSTLVTTVASSAASSLNDMTWVQFEQLVGEGFRLKGYTVTETGGVGAGDGGIDLVLKRGTEIFLVQCKQWRAFKVGVDVVRELFGVMAAKGAAGGFVVTSGTFTADATAFASGRNVILIDGPKLHSMIRTAQASTVPHSATGSQPASAAALCPQCQSKMVLRESKKGALAGRHFWGCSRYPSCRGIRTMA